MKIEMIKQAKQILEAYAEDLEGLTMEECKEAGFSPPQCFVLKRVLGEGEEGKITSPERYQLKQVGFSKEFVETLAGIDGKEALRRRGRWFSWQGLYFFNQNRVKKEAIDPLIEALKDSDWDVRKEAADNLGEIQNARAVPALIDALKDKNEEVRIYVATALGRIGNIRAVPALIEALKDNNPIVRSMVVYALGETQDARAVPVLIEILKDRGGYNHRDAALALAEIGLPSVPALIEMLKDNDWTIRTYAATALGKIGKAHGVNAVAPAIPELEKMAERDPDPPARYIVKPIVEDLMGEMR